ncbi:MAG: hypothetical protein ABSH05_17165 [Bryobacteraceae bacterium]
MPLPGVGRTDRAGTRAPGQEIGELGTNDCWMQHRFELGFDEGTANPEVTAVEFRAR